MAQENILLALNRGIISALGMARIDISRMQYAAATQTNIIPRVLGAAMLRPGLKYITTLRSSTLPGINIPFVFGANDMALLEFTGNTVASNVGALRIIVDDAPLTYPTVTAAVTNGFFINDINNWTDNDESGALSFWTSDTIFNGHMNLRGDGLNAAIRTQEVTVNETGTEHALGVGVGRGPVTLRVGSTSGAEDYVGEVVLGPGYHVLSFTPSGNFFIEFSNRTAQQAHVETCSLETGVLDFGTNYDANDLPLLRYTQSGDVVFLACDGFQQKMVVRRSARSWSFATYETEVGPFRLINTTDITMTPSALTGDITITASKRYFRDEHVGGQIRIASNGQVVQSAISAADNFTDPIKVTGTGDVRNISVTTSGTFSATVTVQYSMGEPGAWVDLTTTYTTATTDTIDDDLDGQIIYYRIGVKAGDYTSGTVTAKLEVASGSIWGVARIYSVGGPTQVSASVIRTFGGTAASKDWWESEWSGYRGWPTAVSIHEGRLWWAGRDTQFGSISDSYYDFDDEVVGDGGTISRTIGFGPIQTIHWLMSHIRLLIGTALNSANIAPALIDGNAVLSARSSSFDEPLTPSNFNIKNTRTTGLFVDRSTTRLMQLVFDGDDYDQQDLNVIAPDLNAAGIRYIAVQVKPDIRIHCVRGDGKVSMLVFDRTENVAAWVEVETDGLIEHAVVLPGTVEDQVYYVVNRTIDGNTVRMLEKWALESECQGGTLNKQADSFYEYSGAPTTNITGLDHLEGESVVVWGAGKDLGTYTVSGGAITLTEAVTGCIVGLTYRGRFRGAKLASMFEGGLARKRKIAQAALMVLNTHYQGVRLGPSFDDLYDMPAVIDGQAVAADTVLAEESFEFWEYGGEWDNDARLHLEANAPKPATIQAVSLIVE